MAKLTMRKLENQIYIEQQAYIKKAFGKKACDHANYGWGVSGDKDYLSVATKVYGHGVLTSEGSLPSGDIDHSFEEFSSDFNPVGIGVF